MVCAGWEFRFLIYCLAEGAVKPVPVRARALASVNMGGFQNLTYPGQKLGWKMGATAAGAQVQQDKLNATLTLTFITL